MPIFEKMPRRMLTVKGLSRRVLRATAEYDASVLGPCADLTVCEAHPTLARSDAPVIRARSGAAGAGPQEKGASKRCQ